MPAGTEFEGVGTGTKAALQQAAEDSKAMVCM